MSNENTLCQRNASSTRTLSNTWSYVLVKEEECDKNLPKVTVFETTNDETVENIKKEVIETIQFLLSDTNKVKKGIWFNDF